MLIKPDFFIVGAPKCGTSAMYVYLSAHPEIFMPARKELHFFGTDLNSYRFVKDIKEYLSYFQDANNKKRVGEASPWYLYSKKAAREIKDFNPAARIIIMLRNPVDMMYALYSQQRYNGIEEIWNFEEALNAEEERKRGFKVPKNVDFVDLLFYKEVAKYYSQVKRYIDTFGRENVHIIIYDDFRENTEAAYRQTLKFLEVYENFIPVFKIINPNKRLRSILLHKFIFHTPKLIAFLAKTFIPKNIRGFLIEKMHKINTKYEPRPPMDIGLRRKLLGEFSEEIDKLSNLIDRDLSFWLKT